MGLLLVARASPSLTVQIHVWGILGTAAESNWDFPFCIRPVSEKKYCVLLLSTAVSVTHCGAFFLAFLSDQYLKEFLEDGGVLTLLDIVSHSQCKEEEKAEALRLLLTVSSAGRKYKEIICESHGKSRQIFLLPFGSFVRHCSSRISFALLILFSFFPFTFLQV